MFGQKHVQKERTSVVIRQAWSTLHYNYKSASYSCPRNKDSYVR